MNAEVAPRVTVRHAAVDDAPAIRALEGLSVASARLLGDELTAPDRCCLVVDAEAAHDGAVVGYAAAIVQLGDAQVIDLVIAPQRRGSGLGGRLLDRLLAAVATRGADAVTLEVAEHNEVAQALYRRRGFVVEGRRPRYYPDGSDALIMWRRTHPPPDREER